MVTSMTTKCGLYWNRDYRTKRLRLGYNCAI